MEVVARFRLGSRTFLEYLLAAAGQETADQKYYSMSQTPHSSQCRIWSLERYAYQTMIGSTDGTDDWQHYDSTSCKLEMTITPTDHVLVHYGKKQLENLPLSRASNWVKGVTKGDSLMVIIKLQNQTRRFRVKFAGDGGETGDRQCRQCVEQLARCFQIKSLNSDTSLSQPAGTPTKTPPPDGNIECAKLAGDVTLSQIAQALTEPDRTQLPSVYTGIHHDKRTDLNTYIKLCLADETFPAFVHAVEIELNAIKAEF